MVEVVLTNEAVTWLAGLGESDQDAVGRLISILEQIGVALGHPYSSAIKGGKYPMRELRVQSGGRPLRVFYVFGVTRDAVVSGSGSSTSRSRGVAGKHCRRPWNFNIHHFKTRQYESVARFSLAGPPSRRLSGAGPRSTRPEQWLSPRCVPFRPSPWTAPPA